MRVSPEHLDLVYRLARRFRGKLPRSVPFDDLISDGTLGLLAAMKTFDPGRRVPFAKYAVRRIRGAMQDGLRQRDWFPRTMRSSGCDVPRIFSFSRMGREWMIDHAARPLDDRAFRSEMIEQLITLRRRERLAVVLYFLEGASMRQTGEIFAMTEAGASLMVKRALTRLAAAATRRDCAREIQTRRGRHG